MTKISLIKCKEYSSDLIGKISNGLTDIGFDLNDFNNKRVALKANLLMPYPAEKAVITHPEFFKAVAKIVKDNGGIPVLIESPAIASLEKSIKKVGYTPIIDEIGIEVAKIEETKTLFNNEGKKFKRFDISKAVFNIDIIINLPKFKTHGITYITGAAKNLFGLIPGMDKAKWHMKAPTKSDFSEFVLDFNEALLNGFEKPKTILHIMDAIVGQEGEGPGPSGTPKKIGAIVIGRNPIAVDYVATNVVGLDFNKVQTITSGFQRNFGITSGNDITIIGEKIDDIKINDFMPSKNSFASNVMRWPFTSKTFRNILTEKPIPQKEKCTLCYQCKKICPAEAITNAEKNKKIPVYDYNKCIRCFCCMEICPEAAIKLKKGVLLNLTS